MSASMVATLSSRVDYSEIEIDTEIEDDSVKSIALNDEKIIKHLDGAEVKKIIYVPGKILNIVI